MPTTFTWTATGTSGDWATKGDWKPNSGPPGAGDVAVFDNLKSIATVNVGKADAITVSEIEFDAPSSAGLITLSITGSLTTGTLDFLTPSTGQASPISVNAGATFDVTTALPNPNLVETISISGKGSGGVGTGGHMILGNLTVGDGSNMAYSFSNNNATGSLANTGVLEFSNGFTTGSSTTQVIENVAHGDEFIIDGANFNGDTVSLNTSTNVLTVKSGTTTVFTMDNVTLQTGAANLFTVSGDTIIALCYARGTMIRTPDGELPIERLRAGKQVVTLADGHEVLKPVKWLGHRRIDFTSHPRPETVMPVRIQRGAFAAQIPHRDLVVSPDHAIYVDGKLICARQLINGTTIRQESDWTAIDYYHVELDEHGILLAEGLPAESYLDTGNIGFFANSGAPLILYPDLTSELDFPTREAGSCAPFVWDEENVRPVWQRLADRAAEIGQPTRRPATTADAELRLVAKGRNVKPIYSDDDLAIFALPRGATEVRLVSRAASPTDTRPWIEDRRLLGVRVARVVVRTADDIREVPVDHPGLSTGWWNVERDGIALRRWTNGDAILPLPALRGDALLEVHFGGSIAYPVDAPRRAA